MPTSTRRRLRLARRGLGMSVAVALVLVAVVIGVANQLLPLAERNPDRVAAWLSARAGRPIQFDRMQTEWTRRGPLLGLEGLRIGAADGSAGTIAVGDAEMLVSLYAGLLPDTPFSELRIRGLDLTLDRDADGRWQVRGLPGQQAGGSDPFAALDGLGELQVIGGRLVVDAPGLGLHARLPRVDLRLRVDEQRVRAGMRAWASKAGSTPLDVSLELERDSGDGSLHAGSANADLAAWSSWLHVAGIGADAGHGRIDAWANLRDHRVDSFELDALLDRVVLRGASLRGQRGLVTRPQARFARVEARARWKRIDTGWRVDAPRLRLTPGDSGGRNVVRVMDGLLLAGGSRVALVADRVDLGPLLSVAALSDRLQPGLRGWILAARPELRLVDVELALTDGQARGGARLESAGFAPVGDAPGMSGLAGTLQGDEDGFVFVPDAMAQARLDWPRGFGTPHVFWMDGDISGWRNGEGWQISTPGLRLAGNELGVHVRGGVAWQGDGTRPRIDMAAEIAEAPLPMAKGFWIRHKMPAAAVGWLDAALVDGRLRDGRALVVGDLDHWPFRGTPEDPAEGLFHAEATIADGVLAFHEDWPALDHVDAVASFVGDGFTVDGKGEIAGVAISDLHAGIPAYREGNLRVQAEGHGDATQLLELLRNSPLHANHADTIDNLAASGPATVSLDLRKVLRRGSGPALVAGTVVLDGVALEDKRWDLAFNRVRGTARYRGDGFRAERLQVRHEGRAGELSLRAGGLARNPANAFEAELEATFDAAELIRRAPQLGWLQPYLAGRSGWQLALSMPRKGSGRLHLESDLVGTVIDLPAPLDKARGVALPATVELALPLERGEVSVALGERMALRARTGGDATGVRVALGTGSIDAPPPASGLVATGRVPALAPLDWVGMLGGGEGGGGMDLRGIDVTADELLLFGGVFPESRLQVEPDGEAAYSVRVQGAALEGAVRVPANGNRKNDPGVSGRFARLHWRPDRPAGADGVATRTTPAEPAAATMDPARIPALAFEIDDLRFNDARLGTASLRTRPVPAGLQIEYLRTRSGAQQLDLVGDWLGRGGSAATRLDARFVSEDFGALVAGLGKRGRLGGGTGSARLEARWPGSPAQFKLAALEGTLELDARDGRLLEVEPGAGRMLGLLSIAELPRRLTLDFGDIFNKGFAFNRFAGLVLFDNGVARSEGLAMDGPAAAITITGAADLRAETFDQTIEVRPKAGNVLTVVGAIAGGPVGAALGAAANAVLQRPLGEAAARTYRVTGPWKDPDVEVVGRDDGELPGAAPAQVPARSSATQDDALPTASR